MDIDGFSEKTAELLYNEFSVKYPYQLYALTVEDLLKLDGFKQKKAQNLIDGINKSKDITLDRLIFALGIPTVGKKAAKQLADKFSSIDKLKSASVEEIVELDDFGQIMAENVFAYFHNEENLSQIEKLFESGVTIRHEEAKEGIFSGKNVVLTGSLSHFKRSQAAQIIHNLGGKTSESVSKSVNLVIVGEDAGSKYDKAVKLGIEIWDENKFLSVIS